MIDEKYKGIVIKLIDYLDADKLASVFTLEKGIILAKFTGVKKEKAKLKAVAQPFTFADFVFNLKGDKRTVTSADIIDSFPRVLSNFNKTICGYIILDMINTLILKEKAEKDIFLLTLSALKELETKDEFIVTINYILKFISFSGLGVTFIETDYAYLDLNGNFTKSRQEIQTDKNVYKLLKDVNSGIEIVDVKDTTKKQALRLLKNIIYLKFNEEIKSFSFI